ncbi:MAG: hypothetical protein EOO60_09475 [Hymenobacter sp.]|nr:MAG: hypothetical protein EOO60_09475 [Hymenobacter sp.]
MTIEEAASFGDERDWPERFLLYARGYFRWLMAGLPVLPSDQLRSLGNSAPNWLDGVNYEIERHRPPINEALRTVLNS